MIVVRWTPDDMSQILEGIVGFNDVLETAFVYRMGDCFWNNERLAEPSRHLADEGHSRVSHHLFIRFYHTIYGGPALEQTFCFLVIQCDVGARSTCRSSPIRICTG